MIVVALIEAMSMVMVERKRYPADVVTIKLANGILAAKIVGVEDGLSTNSLSVSRWKI